MPFKENKSAASEFRACGVDAPRPRKTRRRAQKPVESGNKNSAGDTNSPSTSNMHEGLENDMDANTETQAAAAAEDFMGDILNGFQGVNVNVNVQKNTPNWGRVAEVGCYAGITVAAAAAGMGLFKLILAPATPATAEE